MPWTDEKVDLWIGGLLRAGVGMSAAVVLGAGIWYLSTGQTAPGDHVFRAEPAGLRTVSGIVKGAARGNPQSWIQLGLLLLIATPVARVAFSIFAFAAQRDWTYVAITVLVFGILLYSLVGSG